MKKDVLLLLLLFFFSSIGLGQSTPVPQIGACLPLDHAPLLKKYGYDFIQPTVAEVLQPNNPDSLYSEERMKNMAVSVSAINIFIPGSIKTTGPDVHESAILDYATTVFKRAKKLGIPLIVFGSGASRHIPDGFDRDTAYQQFVNIAKRLALLAARYDVILALESQNKSECNFLNRLSECIAVADAVNHPNFKITVDIYHMMREREPASVIVEGKQHIYHCDIGEKEHRSAPGVAGDDFTPFFRAFQQIGYTGKIALECRFNDLDSELPLAIQTIRQQWLAASNLPRFSNLFP